MKYRILLAFAFVFFVFDSNAQFVDRPFSDENEAGTGDTRHTVKPCTDDNGVIQTYWVWRKSAFPSVVSVTLYNEGPCALAVCLYSDEARAEGSLMRCLTVSEGQHFCSNLVDPKLVYITMSCEDGNCGSIKATLVFNACPDNKASTPEDE